MKHHDGGALLDVLGGSLSKAVSLRLSARSLTRETGLEWSHSISDKDCGSVQLWMAEQSAKSALRLNGSWRTPASHARHDATRHVAGVNPMLLSLGALDRIPDWFKGTGFGGGVGAATAGGGCECR
jgi:hypothetical protein